AGGKDGIHETSGVAHAEQPIPGEPLVAVGKIGGGHDASEKLGVFHSITENGAAFPNFAEEFGSRFLRVDELLLVHHATDRNFFRGKGDDPEPFVREPDHDGIATLCAGINFYPVEMPE